MRSPVRDRLGGTLWGIVENLDYIKDLGINCIYLNPIFTAGSYHKYDTIDYYSIDPCFGTMEDFRKLVASCHKMGIRVILTGSSTIAAGIFRLQGCLREGRIICL